MIRRPPRSTLFPTRRSSDLLDRLRGRTKSRRAIEVIADSRNRRRESQAVFHLGFLDGGFENQDRKSTRLNSSHQIISYAVFFFKKKKTRNIRHVIPWTYSV